MDLQIESKGQTKGYKGGTCGELLEKFTDLEVEFKGQIKGYAPALNHLKGLWTQKSTFRVDGPNRNPYLS
jgi:hypothetical protein